MSDLMLMNLKQVVDKLILWRSGFAKTKLNCSAKFTNSWSILGSLQLTKTWNLAISLFRNCSVLLGKIRKNFILKAWSFPLSKISNVYTLGNLKLRILQSKSNRNWGEFILTIIFTKNKIQNTKRLRVYTFVSKIIHSCSRGMITFNGCFPIIMAQRLTHLPYL